VGAGNYDIVVFLTDGQPTFYGDPQSGGTRVRQPRSSEVEGGGLLLETRSRPPNPPPSRMVGVAIGSDRSDKQPPGRQRPDAQTTNYFLAANFQTSRTSSSRSAVAALAAARSR
jgi:hypothetical protein